MEKGYDELLMGRVGQLKEIEDRMHRILQTMIGLPVWTTYLHLYDLRSDVLRMIDVAEAEHASF